MVNGQNEGGVPLHGPGHSDGEFVLAIQHIYEVLSAWWTDGPQRVGAAFQLCNDQVRWHVALQPLQGVLTAAQNHIGTLFKRLKPLCVEFFNHTAACL